MSCLLLSPSTLPIVAPTGTDDAREIGPKRVEVDENSQVTLECTLPSGATQVTWSRENNTPLPSQHYFERHLLIIPRIKRSDGGTYYCTAQYTNSDPQTTPVVVIVNGEVLHFSLPCTVLVSATASAYTFYHLVTLSVELT